MYRTGDIVRIINNKIFPEYEGSIGKISKAYPTYDNNGKVLYSINVRGKVIQGLAEEKDFEFLSPSEK